MMLRPAVFSLKVFRAEDIPQSKSILRSSQVQHVVCFADDVMTLGNINICNTFALLPGNVYLATTPKGVMAFNADILGARGMCHSGQN